MSNYRLTPRAKKDLIAVARYTRREWGVQQRDKYIRELFDLLVSMGERPQLGNTRDELRPDLLSRQHKKTHTIYYRVGADNVPEIVRVLHSSQDAQRHLSNADDSE
jgi:toxin ParE1/3/4